MTDRKIKKQGERQKKERIFLISFSLFFLIVAGFLIFSNWKINQKKKEMLGRIQALSQDIESLNFKKQNLEQGILESEDQSYLEARMRELGYQKPGETVVVIKKDQQAGPKETISQNFWQRFMGEVKNIFK